MSGDPREELASLAASLRSYIEWQKQTGTTGFPRPSTPTSTSTSTPSADRHVRLPALAREVSSCTKCALAVARTQTVFARGNPDAQLCFIGEAPGADEDAQGLPFVGRAGQLLDRMIVAMGLSPHDHAYVCNIIKCRPPGNRRPEPEEIATCIPYLHEQLALIHPRVIVALGNTAVAALLETKLGITKVRGQWKLYRGQTLVMPTYHPSYLLRPGPQQTEAKRQAWEDLQLVMKELGLPLPATKR
ncbi:MAG: uracil-DNA glycosylase [Myxococcota bacterium]|nr:uracil-DNA glycosylase [Myxococcota bacterium]